MSYGSPSRRRPYGLILAAELRNATGQDFSSANRTPTVGAGVTFTGGVADFDGSSSAVISYQHTTDTETPPFSICAWIKIDTYTGLRALASDITQTSTAYEGWHFYIGPGISRGLGFGQTDSSTLPVTTNYKQVWTATGTLSAGVWYHVAATIESLGATPIIYVNGTAVATTVVSSGSISSLGNSESMRIAGKGAPEFTQYFDGKMQFFRMFNRVLTAAEVGAIYAGTSGVTRP